MTGATTDVEGLGTITYAEDVLAPLPIDDAAVACGIELIWPTPPASSKGGGSEGGR